MEINLLILDDDAFYVSMLIERLRSEADFAIQSIQTNSVHDAKDAVRSALIEFDCFLVDYKLGSDMAGIDALQDLRGLSPNTEAILLTGYGNADVGMRAYQAGAYRYLQKPFEIAELLWIVESIHGLRTLNQLAADAQRVTSLQEVADVITSGSVKLGFERARLFLVDEDSSQLSGISQVGFDDLGDFTKINFGISDSPYTQLTMSNRETQFFNGLDLGESFLAKHYDEKRFPRPVGEWVDVVLRDGDECIGILALDNHKKPREYHAEQRRILRLLAHQVGGALYRALQHLEERQVSEANHVVRSVIKQTSELEIGIDKLLLSLYESISSLISTQNFVVVLNRANENQLHSDWLQTRLHIEDDSVQNYSSRVPDRRGLTQHLFSLSEPLFCPEGTIDYRKKHNLPPPRDRIAKCWMGFPIRVHRETFGVVLIEEYLEMDKWTQSQFELCGSIIEQLSHYIYSTWLNQQLNDFVQPLTVLQRASGTIIELAQEKEEWLWHATLSLMTANYGFCFDRAMLFLLDKSGKWLNGQLGIGHLNWDDAEKAWKEDKEENLTSFDEYIDRLKNGSLRMATPVDKKVRSMSLLVDDAGIISDVIRSGQIDEIDEIEAAERMPMSFINAFGKTDYSIVPVKAGERILGVVILDNVWGKEPQNRTALEYICAVTNEAALVHDILHAHKAQKILIEIPSNILANTNNEPLKENLKKIGKAAQFLMQADSISIYPFEVESSPPALDSENSIWIEDSSEYNLEPQTELSDFMSYLSRKRKAICIDDVSQIAFNDVEFTNDPVVKQKDIKSFIGVPIVGLRSRQVRGLMYINYSEVREMNDEDRFQAYAFASLVALVLRNWREGRGFLAEKQALNEELALLHDVLADALLPNVETSDLIAKILGKTQELLRLPDLSIAILLKEWRPPSMVRGEPQKVWHEYQLGDDGLLQEGSFEEYYGLSALAMDQGTTINTPNVHSSEFSKIYYDRQIGTESEIDVPIKLDEQPALGVINVESPNRSAFTNSHKNTLERLAFAAALALDNTWRRKQLLSILNVAKAVTEQTSLPQTLQQIVDEIHRLLPDLSALTVWHTEPDSDKVILGKHFGIRDEERLEAAEDPYLAAHGYLLVRKLMSTKEPLWCTDVTKEPLLDRSTFPQREGIVSMAALPLCAHQRNVGVIFLNYRHRHFFTESEYVLFPILAEIIAAAINDAVILQKEERQEQRLEAALAIANEMGASVDLNYMLEKAIEHLIKLNRGTYATILLYDPHSDRLNLLPFLDKYYEIGDPNFRNTKSFAVDESSFAGYLAKKSQESEDQIIEIIRNTDKANRPYMSVNSEVKSIIGSTLVTSEGELLGVLLLGNINPDTFNGEDKELVRGITRQIRIMIERSRSAEEREFHGAAMATTIWAADAAHDINSEIYAMRSIVSWLEREPNITVKGREHVSRLYDSIDRIGSFAPWQPQQIETIALNEKLNEWICRELRSYGTQIKFDIQIEPPELAVEQSPQSIQLILRHLLRNSVRAMQKHSPPWMIRVSAQKSTDTHFTLRIEDSGPGIPDGEIRQRLFYPQNSKRKSGGLGLTTVRIAVEALKGEIRPVYEDGKGAIFSIKLPLKHTVNGEV